MPWTKIDDQFYDHPKVVAAGPLGVALFVCSLSYCARHLTDGFITTTQAKRLIDVDDPLEVAEQLVAVGLWERRDGGYQVHDYLEYNPSRAHVEATRQVRAEAGRTGGLRSGEARREQAKEIEEANAKQSGSKREAKTNPIPSPIPVPNPIPEPTNTESATPTQAPQPVPSESKKPLSEKKPPLTVGCKEFLRLFSAKRFANNAQREAVMALEHEHGTEKFTQAATWAAERGMSRGKAILAMRTALPKWGQPRASPSSDGKHKGPHAGILEWMESKGVTLEAQ